MPIKCNLSTLMGANKYKVIDVHKKTGLSRTTISKLYYDKMERIDYGTLDKLCELFDCEVQDILVYYKK